MIFSCCIYIYRDFIAIRFGLQPFESFRKAAQQQQPIGYGSYCPSPKPTARRLEIRTPLLGLGKNCAQVFFFLRNCEKFGN